MELSEASNYDTSVLYKQCKQSDKSVAKVFLKTLTDVFYELLVILPKFIKFLTHHESCITFLKITEKVLKKKNK